MYIYIYIYRYIDIYVYMYIYIFIYANILYIRIYIYWEGQGPDAPVVVFGVGPGVLLRPLLVHLVQFSGALEGAIFAFRIHSSIEKMGETR